MAVSIPKEGRQAEYRSDWATPQAVFDIIDAKYGEFTLDPCATAENAKCRKFFIIEDNGLAQSWEGETVFVNPPYGRELPLWTTKALREMEEHNVYSVFLIPPRVGTPWFQDFCKHASEVLFLRGRVPFIDPAGNRTSPMDDNCLVVLDPEPIDVPTRFGFWDWKADILKHLPFGEAALRSVTGKKASKAA